MSTRRFVSWILLAAAIGGGLAACSSGSSSSSSSTPTSAPPSSAAAAPSASSTSSGSSSSTAAAEKAVATNWVAFFNPKTPVAQRVSLLQDGQTFSSVIKAQAGSSLASQASAKVTKVTVTSPTQAAVTYTILLAGQPVLKNQSGTAVYQGGTWKVGLASFCGLLTVENAGNTSSLPAACKSAA